MAGRRDHSLGNSEPTYISATGGGGGGGYVSLYWAAEAEQASTKILALLGVDPLPSLSSSSSSSSSSEAFDQRHELGLEDLVAIAKECLSTFENLSVPSSSSSSSLSFMNDSASPNERARAFIAYLGLILALNEAGVSFSAQQQRLQQNFLNSSNTSTMTNLAIDVWRNAIKIIKRDGPLLSPLHGITDYWLRDRCVVVAERLIRALNAFLSQSLARLRTDLGALPSMLTLHLFYHQRVSFMICYFSSSLSDRVLLETNSVIFQIKELAVSTRSGSSGGGGGESEGLASPELDVKTDDFFLKSFKRNEDNASPFSSVFSPLPSAGQRVSRGFEHSDRSKSISTSSRDSNAIPSSSGGGVAFDLHLASRLISLIRNDALHHNPTVAISSSGCGVRAGNLGLSLLVSQLVAAIIATEGGGEGSCNTCCNLAFEATEVSVRAMACHLFANNGATSDSSIAKAVDKVVDMLVSLCDNYNELTDKVLGFCIQCCMKKTSISNLAFNSCNELFRMIAVNFMLRFKDDGDNLLCFTDVLWTLLSGCYRITGYFHQPSSPSSSSSSSRMDLDSNADTTADPAIDTFNPALLLHLSDFRVEHLVKLTQALMISNSSCRSILLLKMENFIAAVDMDCNPADFSSSALLSITSRAAGESMHLRIFLQLLAAFFNNKISADFTPRFLGTLKAVLSRSCGVGDKTRSSYIDSLMADVIVYSSDSAHLKEIFQGKTDSSSGIGIGIGISIVSGGGDDVSGTGMSVYSTADSGAQNQKRKLAASSSSVSIAEPGLDALGRAYANMIIASLSVLERILNKCNQTMSPESSDSPLTGGSLLFSCASDLVNLSAVSKALTMRMICYVKIRSSAQKTGSSSNVLNGHRGALLTSIENFVSVIMKASAVYQHPSNSSSNSSGGTSGVSSSPDKPPPSEIVADLVVSALSLFVFGIAGGFSPEISEDGQMERYQSIFQRLSTLCFAISESSFVTPAASTIMAKQTTDRSQANTSTLGALGAVNRDRVSCLLDATLMFFESNAELVRRAQELTPAKVLSLAREYVKQRQVTNLILPSHLLNQTCGVDILNYAL